MQNLSVFKKMGKGLKKFEKTAKKARDYGKKVYPTAEKAWAVAAPKNHDKYAPKLAKGYKTFNTEANKMGGWGSVEKAADALEKAGLLNMIDADEINRVRANLKPTNTRYGVTRGANSFHNNINSARNNLKPVFLI